MGNSASSNRTEQRTEQRSTTLESSLTSDDQAGPFTPTTTTGGSPPKSSNDPTQNLANEKVDIDGIIRGIWSFIFSYTDGAPPEYHPRPILTMLKEIEELFRNEPTVLDLEMPQCVVGDLHGQGDTLITLLSLADTPPKRNYIFLGNYTGQGFAPHETLFLLFALKVKYPFKVHLLRGNLEGAETMKAHDFIGGLARRNLMENAFVWMRLERIFQLMPLAAVVGKKYLCLHGGIGPQLRRVGLSRLREVERPPVMPLDIALTLECQWACLRTEVMKEKLSTLIPEMLNDGSPLFSEKDVEQFCRDNNLHLIIRSRQIANEGVLNLPAQLLTVWSAVSYLDNFRNMAAVLVVDGDKSSIVRYKQVDMEPESLDDKKPMAGRNAMNI